MLGGNRGGLVTVRPAGNHNGRDCSIIEQTVYDPVDSSDSQGRGLRRREFMDLLHR